MKNFKNFKIRGNDNQIKKQIQDLCKQIVAVAHPEKIILFGSYAYGEPNDDSDIDLMIIKSFTEHPWDQAAKLRLQIETDMPLDLLVRTPEYVAQRTSIGDSFMQEITEQGTVLYETDYAGMDKQSRGRLVKRAA